jgi:hypothetical protein
MVNCEREIQDLQVLLAEDEQSLHLILLCLASHLDRFPSYILLEEVKGILEGVVTCSHSVKSVLPPSLQHFLRPDHMTELVPLHSSPKTIPAKITNEKIDKEKKQQQQLHQNQTKSKPRIKRQGVRQPAKESEKPNSSPQDPATAIKALERNTAVKIQGRDSIQVQLNNNTSNNTKKSTFLAIQVGEYVQNA